MPIWRDKLLAFTMGVAANPTRFFRISPSRVVEIGMPTSA
jgi:K+ transporter